MQSPAPLVTVLIPAYNEEAYIAKTLQALMQQDYPNFEVIVVNNASTDRTASVVASFVYYNGQTFKIRLLHEKRQGTQAARECGRRASKGEIIAQLDADCVPPSNWISTGVTLLQQKACAAVAGPYDYFDARFLIRTFTHLSQLFILQPLNQLVQFLKRGGIIIGGNAFILAAVLEKSGGYNTALKFYGDDVDIALKLSKHGHILFTKKIMVKSSSRRYNALGFFGVQAKYTKAFFQTIFRNSLDQNETIELLHPR